MSHFRSYLHRLHSLCYVSSSLACILPNHMSLAGLYLCVYVYLIGSNFNFNFNFRLCLCIMPRCPPHNHNLFFVCLYWIPHLFCVAMRALRVRRPCTAGEGDKNNTEKEKEENKEGEKQEERGKKGKKKKR